MSAREFLGRFAHNCLWVFIAVVGLTAAAAAVTLAVIVSLYVVTLPTHMIQYFVMSVGEMNARGMAVVGVVQVLWFLVLLSAVEAAQQTWASD